MQLVECPCGTLYHVERPVRQFRCGNCGRPVSTAGERSRNTDDRMPENPSLRVVRWICILGCTIGISLLLLTLPTLLMLKSPLSFLSLIFELVFGTILVCASLAFYLLSVQVQSMQYMMNLHMNNLRIFADQISKLKLALRRKNLP